MLNIINDIISISKIESGQMESFISTTNINDLLAYHLNFFHPEAAQKGNKLTCTHWLSEQNKIIQTDSEKVYAILTNLIKNAVKFTKQGSIEFGCEQKTNFLEFFVKDTGTGISREKQEVIFERFIQGSSFLTRNYEGAGLGLSISKAYVKMLGGEIWVQSKEGVGSTFYFTIANPKE
jgi:signal transduction histidine kinase